MRLFVRSVALLLLSIAVLFLTNCGGGGSSTPPPTQPATQNPSPTITSLQPDSVVAGTAATTVTINGTGFMSSSSVQWGSATHAATFVSASQLQVALTAQEVASGATVAVSVTNPAPGGGTSSAATFTINNPTPVVSSISPSSAQLGDSATTVTITGSGFVPASVVNVNGGARSTAYVNSTSVKATLTAADLASAAVHAITVTNGGPGGGTSPSTSFTVNNPTPVVTGITPLSITVGTSAATVTIAGTGFVPSSTVHFNGAARPTTFVSATQVKADLASTDLASASTASITVVNPSPGGGSSAPATFTVNNPAPTISSISPSSVTLGAAATTVTVSGTGFISTSKVQINGSLRTTAFVSATELKADLTAADFATAGAKTITVVNASPGGGSSPAGTLTVNNPLPAIATLSPSTLVAQSPSTTVTVTGSGFVPGSTVRVDGNLRTTTFVDSSTLNFVLPASDLAAVAQLQVTVSNPTPGGGVSAAFLLQIGNGTPIISSIWPTQMPSGNRVFTLYVQGGPFTSWSVINFGGTPVPTTYYWAANLLEAQISTNLAVGTIPITVTNPPPLGGTSPALNLTVVPMAITSVSPNTMYVNAPDTVLGVAGGGFTSGSVIEWNGSPLTTTFFDSDNLSATVPASKLTVASTATVQVLTDGTLSNPLSVRLIDSPKPTLVSVYPNSAAVGSGPLDVTLWGGGFTEISVVKIDGVPVPTTYQSSGYLRATIPVSMLQKFGTQKVVVENPAPGGSSTALPFTTYLGLATKDIVYDKWSKLIYASVPSTSPSFGNTVVGIDPVTGNVVSSVFVGSEPNRLAISDDGTTLWVGLDGSAAVRKVDLTTMSAGLQFGLGGGPGVYNPPYTALDIAVMPGSPNTIAISTGSSTWGAFVGIYDSGVARAKQYNGGGYIAFDDTGSKLYAQGGGALLNIDSTGVASSGTFTQSSSYYGTLSFAAGRLYLSNGTVVDGTTGALLATFYTAPSQISFGYSVPDTINRKVFVLSNSYPGNTVYAYDMDTYVSKGSVTVNGASNSYSNSRMIRWGENGLAFRTDSQLFIFRSDIVKDVSTSSADVALSIAAPATSTTGTPFAYTVTVTNNGPNTATDVLLINTAPTAAAVNSIVASQGTCMGYVISRCNLGSIASAATATVTINVTPLSPGSVVDSAIVSAVEPDAVATNNSATAAVTSSGAVINPSPVISSMSPMVVAAGSSTFKLTVTGTNFADGDTIQWNGTDLTTTFVDSSTLTADVPASNVSAMGYAWVNVFAPAPGGGLSASLPVMVYKQLTIETNSIVYEPFTRKIYATIPSTATSLTGNSVVSIDPVAGSVSSPVNIGSQPNQMALSDDGKYLFVGLEGSKSVARFNLANNSPDFTFTLGTSKNGDQLSPKHLSVAPGNPNLLAVSTGSWPGAGLFDISGTTATLRGNLTGAYNADWATFADGTHVYTYDSYTSYAMFYRWNVTPTGLTLIDNTTLFGIGGFGGSFQLGKGKLFGVGGGVVDPTTTPPSMIGRFAASGPNAADVWLGRSFFFGCPTDYPYCNNQYLLMAFDHTKFVRTNAVAVPGSAVADVIRWGRDGLAYRTVTDTYNTASSTGVVLLRGPIVVPELGRANVVATVSSMSPNSVTAGATNMYMTITGSGFVPGAVALWNGEERTTYVVDSSHLSVALPATDLATAGSASVTVMNPGASAASSALTFTVN